MANRRIALRVAYDGTDYAGWQCQPGLRTVQGEIERNLQRITGERIALHGSGRTDAGVHALGQVAHFDTVARMPAERFAIAINTGLESDIRVLDSREVSADFHARFTAKRKRYRYVIRNAPIASALNSRYELHLHRPLDIDRMHQAAAFALGEHDFAAFAATGSRIKSTVRTLYESHFTQQGACICYETVGNGYLYHMVRMLVGTFIDIGYGRFPVSIVPQMLDGGGHPSFSATTAPAHGLFLVDVDYD